MLIQSEVSQKEKNKYRMLTHIYGIKKKMVLKNGLEGTGRGKGKLGRSERVALTYTQYQM